MTAATDAKPATETPDGLPTPRRHWAISAVWLSMAASVLDGTIANVALPTIARELQADAAASIWVVNAYQLAVTVALLPLAALGDKLGYRRVYLTGLAVFTLGALTCALSRSLEALVAGRVVQGLGAAAIMSINPALVRFIFPKAILGRGIGLNALVIALSAALGPTLASAVLGLASWPWLFAVNVPVALAAIAIGVRSLPRTLGSARPFDWLSAMLSALALGFLILGAESLAREGLLSGLAKLAIGGAAAALLIRRELRREAPLVPLDLLRLPIFGMAVATSVVSFAAQMMAFVALPFFFQGVLGRTAVATGLLMTPWPLAVAVAAPLAGRLADRYRAGALGGFGLALMASGLVALSLLRPGAVDLDIAWRMALCGFGFGFFQAPNNRAMISSAPLERSGAAGGMLATARLLGQTAGAVGTAVFFALADVHASNAALATAGGFAAVATLISLSRLRLPSRPRPEPPDTIGPATAGP